MNTLLRCPFTASIALAFAVMLFAGLQRANALATEQVGNAPVPAGWTSFTADLIPVLNDPSRIYWREVNGDANFFYKGGKADLNALLKRFADGGKGREVVLHAGRIELTTFNRSKKFDANWEVHVPGGISLSNYADGGLVTDKGPAVHIYLSQTRISTKEPPQKIAGWLKELDSDTFAVRQRAASELAKLGHGVEADLRKALATTSSAEVRRTIKTLLGKLPDITLDGIEIPATLTVVGPDDLRARLAKGLHSKNTIIRGVAAGVVAELEPDRKKAVEGLRKVLKEDKNEYVRRCVIGALQREGKNAELALPELRAGLSDPDVNVKNACKAAVETIEKAKKVPDAEAKAKRRIAIEKDIRAFLMTRSSKKTP